MSTKRLSKLDAPKLLKNDEKVMKENDFIVSKTDTKGFITYCNQIFIDMCQYSPDELIGANHNLIRHPDMPRIAFKLCWQLIQNRQEFFGFVKNLRKDGGYYWVFANITASIDTNNNIIGYYSVRRKPSRKGLEAVIPLYKKLVDEKKMVNTIYAYNMDLKDPGIFLFMAVCNPAIKAETVEKEILEEIEKIKRGEIDKEELEKIKINTKADFIFSLENSSNVADLFGSYFARGNIEPLLHYEENIDKLTPKDLEEVAKKYFYKENSTTVILRKEKR
jgi:PAS domain S-box-containing protein